MVESAPVTIKEGAPKDEAADIQADRGGRRQGRAQVGRCAFSRLT